MIELTEHFVACADEVWRLQRDDDPECLWFRRAVHGHEKPSRGSMQGTYVLSAGGVLLGRLNSLDPEAIAGMLETALERWDELPAEARGAAAAIEVGHRWEDSYPADGLVLQRVVRDLPESFDPTEAALRPSNVDQAWFSAEEARRWLPADVAAGAEHVVPEVLLRRLACFHLVDNVRGQTLPYAPEEVSGQLHARVVSVGDGFAEIEISGEISAETDGSWRLGDSNWTPDEAWPRAIRTALYGTARYALDEGAFTRFDLVALGSRTGRTKFNARRHDVGVGPFPIGFSFEIAPAAPRVAPTFLNLYGAAWVVRPGE